MIHSLEGALQEPEINPFVCPPVGEGNKLWTQHVITPWVIMVN